MKLRNKLILYIFSTLAVLLITIVSFYIFQVREKSEKDFRKINERFVQESSGIISNYYNGYLIILRTISKTFPALQNNSKEVHNDIIKTTLYNVLSDNIDIDAVWYNRQLKILDTNWVRDDGRFEMKYYRLGNSVDYIEDFEKDTEQVEYKQVRLKNKEVIYEPYLGSNSGKKEDEKLYMNVAVPLQINDVFAGLIGMDFPLDKLSKQFDSFNLYDESFSLILHNKGTFIYHTQSEYYTKHFNTFFSEEFLIKSNFEEKFKSKQSVSGNYINNEGNEFYYSFIAIAPTNGDDYLYFGSFIPYDVLNKERNSILSFTLLVTAIGLIIVFLITVLLSKMIVSPIEESSKIAATIGSGDFTVKTSFKSKDELGKLVDSLMKMAGKLSTLISNIKNGSDELNTIGIEEQKKSAVLMNYSAEIATSIEEVSTSLEEIDSRISATSDITIIAEDLSNHIGKGITKSSELVRETSDSMKLIGDKIKIISEIAMKTNILALNAAVEAARAGEFGKGFAVVATEVKKLSDNAKDAAKEIIETAQQGVQISKESVDKLSILIPDIEKILGIVKEIALATNEIKVGIQQINRTISILNDSAQENSATSELLTENSKLLINNSNKLNALVNIFKIND